MIRLLLALLSSATLYPHAVFAQAIDYARSQITVQSRQMNVPVEAPFKKFTAQVTFDANKPEASSARVEIDLNSFDIGDAETNDNVKDKNWFDTKTYPIARFASSSIRSLGGGRFEVRGPLMLKGKTMDVAAPFTVKASGADRIFEGAFPIRRLQFNVGDGVWRDTSVVADEVQIKFRLYQVASKPAAAK
jgi:polyisoprenoid-binding protein YceI